MCLQCDTKAVIVQQDILPGFSLYQAQVDAADWPKGWYGLVECNDPTFVFAGPLLSDPTFGMSDEALNALKDFPAGYDEFCAAADAVGEKLVGCPMAGYSLVRACMEVGYRRTDGHVHYWLLHHLATKVGVPTEPSAS